MTFIELAQNRYSVRKYTNQQLEKEKLDKLLQVAMLAPTAKNLQPQRIYVLQSEESLKKMDELSKCRYGAPTVLVFTYNTDEEWINPFQEDIHSGVEDVSIVATHVMMEAEELGLNTTWCNMFGNTELERAFDLPKNEKSVLFLCLGYKDDASMPAPMHEQSKSINTVVKYL